MTATAPAADRPSRRSVGLPTLAPALVERDSELRRLLEAVTGPPRVAVVHGEAGVGKSRLVAEAARLVDTGERRRLLGRCRRSGAPFPLGPVVDALGLAGQAPPAGLANPLLGALRPLLPEWAQHLPPEPVPASDPAAARHRTFRALRVLLDGLGPTVCVIEDLQWADEQTLELLDLVASTPPRGLALVLTCRTEGRDPASSTSGVLWRLLRRATGSPIALAPLTPDGVRALAAGLLGAQAVSRELAAGLHAWTGGIPGVVGEVVEQLRDAADQDAPARGASSAPERLPVPALLREQQAARLDALSEEARLVACAAAAAGSPAEESFLCNVAGLRTRAGAAALLEALDAGVLQEWGNGAYGFRHPLAARAAYETIGGPRRRRLHERAAHALESDGRAGTLPEVAHHLKEAGAANWPRVAEAAAAEASAAGDVRLAVRLLEDALSSAELSRAARIRMVLALGDAALYCNSSAGAIGILQRTLDEETLPAGVRGEVRFSLSRLLGHAGASAASRTEAVLAVGELRRRPALGVRAMVNLAQPWSHRNGHPDDHRAWLDRAVQTAGRQTDRVARIAVCSQRAAILLSQGDSAGWAAVRDIPAAGALPEEKLQLSRGYRSLAEASLSLGYYRRAEAFLADADRLHDATSNRSWGLWLEAVGTSLDWCRGRWDGLEHRLRSLLPETAATPTLAVGNRFLLGALLLARGERDEAGQLLTSVLETPGNAIGLMQHVTVSGRLARLHLDGQDPRSACDVVAGALAEVRAKQLWVPGRTVLPEAVQALLAGGEQELAREVVAEFSAGLRGRDAPAARAALAWCRGVLAEADARCAVAARHFARAEAGWARLGNDYEAARARERSARCSMGTDRESARGGLLSAGQTYERLGAEGDARRIRSAVKAHGVWRGGRNGYGAGLSPREEQVAALAGGGLTNREIAARLCISPRTVELHVAASLRKLHLRSRHELGAGERAGKDT